MAAPNDTTKFELAFLIIWLILTTVLIVLIVLRRLALPTLIRGDKIFSAVFVFLQLVIFIFLLAALGHDGWTEVGGGNGYHMGLVKGHSIGSQANANIYDCTIPDSSEARTMCGTQKAAGIFVLLFGLAALFNSLAMLIAIVAALLSKSTPLGSFIAMMSNLQWVFIQFMVFVWGICFHDIMVQQGQTNITLGPSWVLSLIALFIAIPAAMFYGGGAGVPLHGGGSASETKPPPQQDMAGAGPAVMVAN